LWFNFISLFIKSEAEFKEFEPRFIFKPRLKYGWFYLKYFKVKAGAQLKPVFGIFETRLKFIKFGHWFLVVDLIS